MSMFLGGDFGVVQELRDDTLVRLAAGAGRLRKGPPSYHSEHPWYAEASDLAAYCAVLRRIEPFLTRSS
jgi:hypothetical protein